MDFQQRLQKAVERGRKSRDDQELAAAQHALSIEELRRLHSKYRLELTEKIEEVLGQLSDQFPGFQLETIVDERGWGSAIVRDDLNLVRNRGRSNLYSRLEMVIRPFSEYHVLDLAVKGAIHNKEVISRNHFQLLAEVDLDTFKETVALWALDYAEQFSARG